MRLCDWPAALAVVHVGLDGISKSSDLGESASEYSELAGAGHLELLLLTYLHLEVPVVFLPHVEHDARLPLYVSDAVQVGEGPLKHPLTLRPVELEPNARVPLVPQYPELEASDLEDEALLGQESPIEVLNLLIYVLLFEGALEFDEGFWEDAPKGHLVDGLGPPIIVRSVSIVQTFNNLVCQLLSLGCVEILG